MMEKTRTKKSHATVPLSLQLIGTPVNLFLNLLEARDLINLEIIKFLTYFFFTELNHFLSHAPIALPYLTVK